MSTTRVQPFNQGEIEIQTKLGVHEQVMAFAPRVIREFMPDQHREFFAQLPLLFVGSIDARGRPWASAVFGRPGFLHAPQPTVLQVNTHPSFGDPLNYNLQIGNSLGFLGLEHHTRRRNRLSGKVAVRDANGFEIAVDQSFGNCPRYIHARTFDILPEIDQNNATLPMQRFRKLGARAKKIIADTRSFFIASYFREDANNPSHGADVSHRGGEPGFVKISGDDTLTYPEFSGNLHYNTLGNIHKNPLAGLLFMDFDNGDMLYLTCSAEIIWESEDLVDFDGAQQLVRFRLDQGILVQGAMPLRWQSQEASANFYGLGTWKKVAQKQNKRANEWQDYRVTTINCESSSIESFHLEPLGGGPVPSHKAGQFLPIKVQAPGWDKPEIRTYTISSGPGSPNYRLSIKRETGGNGNEPGLVSNFFHRHVGPGSIISARKPGGSFTLHKTDNRPIVLLSAGVGITPMISMMADLAQENDNRKLWFLHGARNSRMHAFRNLVSILSRRLPQAEVFYSYSQPLASDRLGVDYDQKGHIDMAVLKTLLPFDDYQFYLCGPELFMQGLYAGLRDMNIAEDRIHYEFFGKGGLKPPKVVEEVTAKTVRFEKSGVEATWTGKGSLLALAEAAGLEPPSSCRVGACNTCVTNVVHGKVTYPDGQPPGLAQGQALICLAQPDPNSKKPLVLDV